MEGIRLCQLIGIIREGGACFSIQDEDGREYCDEYRGGIPWITEEPWYKGIKNRVVSRMVTVGGNGFPVETRITLAGKKPWEKKMFRTRTRKTKWISLLSGFVRS